MPGHIDAQGHVIGDGNCPFWAGVAKKNAAKKASAGTIKSVANAAVSIPTQASTTIRTALDDDIERATRQYAMASTVRAIPPAQPAPVAPVEVDAVAENSHVTITIGAMAFTLPRATVAVLVGKLLTILISK